MCVNSLWGHEMGEGAAFILFCLEIYSLISLYIEAGVYIDDLSLGITE